MFRKILVKLLFYVENKKDNKGVGNNNRNLEEVIKNIPEYMTYHHEPKKPHSNAKSPNDGMNVKSNFPSDKNRGDKLNSEIKSTVKTQSIINKGRNNATNPLYDSKKLINSVSTNSRILSVMQGVNDKRAYSKIK
jgi:hypothetical protein